MNGPGYFLPRQKRGWNFPGMASRMILPNLPGNRAADSSPDSSRIRNNSRSANPCHCACQLASLEQQGQSRRFSSLNRPSLAISDIKIMGTLLKPVGEDNQQNRLISFGLIFQRWGPHRGSTTRRDCPLAGKT
jgi:hypothetical protein